MTIGARLKYVRNRFEMSLESTASIFDITAQTLSRYENGRRSPDNEFLEQFGKHFNLSGNWLLYGEAPVFKATEESGKDINEAFYELSSLIGVKKVNDIDLLDKLKLKIPLEKLTEDSPENYILLFEYMMKYEEVRKAMFQFFYVFQKPAADERAEVLKTRED